MDLIADGTAQDLGITAVIASRCHGHAYQRIQGEACLSYPPAHLLLSSHRVGCRQPRSLFDDSRSFHRNPWQRPQCVQDIMRYSTLASTVLLVVATAPTLAHPVIIRTTEDASMVERELQDALMERGYYDDLLSRDLEARKSTDDAVSKPAAASAQRQRQMPVAQWRERAAQRQSQKRFRDAQHSGYRPGPSHPHQNGGAGQGAGGQHHPRESDLDGELFIRTTEDASVVERELHDALMERGYYGDLLSRDLETRKNADKPDESRNERYHRERQEYMLHRGDNMMRHAQGQRHSAGTSNGAAQRSRSQPRPPPPHQNGGAGQGATGRRHSREYDLDGGLFERGFEVDELD